MNTKTFTTDLFEVTYVITDRGTVFPEEIAVVNGKNVTDSLKKHLRTYRRAMDLSPKFTFEIISKTHAGWIR